MAKDDVLETGFNGLSAAQPALPASWYHDPVQFAREMREIWHRQWVYLCRADTLDGPGAYRLFDVAGQEVILLRDGEGSLRGFYNTCRHRGSALCTAASGRLHGRLTCPYHQWSYALDGRLLATGPMRRVAGFAREDHGLYPVAVAERAGCVFVHLASETAPPFDAVHGDELANIAAWPVADLVSAHRMRREIACNWKVFWENYNECLHCPGVHPELSELVPIYGRGLMERQDDPDWKATAGDRNPRLSGGLRTGAETWSVDGRAQDAMPGLGPEERDSGQRFATLLPSVFVSAHLDHLRIVRLMPLAPERTELVAEWLVRKEALARADFDITRITVFSEKVLGEDAAACELNQRGLRAAPFEHGVLMQEEYDVFRFQDWVREALGEPRPAGSGSADSPQP